MLTRVDSTHKANLQPNTSVIYYHFAGSLETFRGTIIAVKETGKSRFLLIEPDKREDMSLCNKWIVWADIVSYGWTAPDSAEGTNKQAFAIGGNVRIKQHVDKDLSYFLRLARDTRLALKIVALNTEPGEYQVKVEYTLTGHYTKTALFRLNELEAVSK